MFSWRSARGRAMLAGMVLMLLLAVAVGTGVWRARDVQERNRSLEHTSTTVTSLERVQARFFEGLAILAAMVWTDEPPLEGMYRQTVADMEEGLSLARAEALAKGDAKAAARVENLSEQSEQFNEGADLLVSQLLGAGPGEGLEIATALMPELMPQAYGIRDELEQVVEEELAGLAAERAAADRAADMTMWLLVGLGLVAFTMAAGALVSLVRSVVRPLTSLQASVRAIASGDLEARARVAGPEEVASLARDFNEMVSERQRAEELFETLARGSPIGMSVVQDGKLRFVNSQFEEYTGYSADELLGSEALALVAPEDRQTVEESAAKVLRGETSPPYEFKAVNKAGKTRWVVGAVARIDHHGSPALALSCLDISERKWMEEALREQVRRDQLTGVLNHAAIVKELRELISDGSDGASHAVVVVDVNDLKATNEAFGHDVGDAVLVAVARALSREGVIVGRYGGDDFVAVLPGSDRKTAEGYREEVLETLAATDLRDPESGARVPAAASVGLAIYPTEAGRIEELISLADSETHAARRQRPVGRSSRAPARPLGSEEAAKMVGELVPLLTAPGDLNEKLRLVAHRLSVGAGYYAVAFQVVFGPLSEESTAQNVFGLASDQATGSWIRDSRRLWEHPLRPFLERTQRPIIVEDPQHDKRLTANDRRLARGGGVRSALIAPMIWRDRVAGHLTAMSKRKAAFAPRDAEFLMAVATQVTAIVRMSRLIDDLKTTSARLAEAQAETVMMLAAAAEAHDHTTGLHLQNVRGITQALALDLGYGEEEAKGLGLAAVLHDIGKVRVPDSMLSSTGRLADEEWELMKHHTTWGAEFLAGRLGFELAANIARSHHERWDGSGYPDGLAGEAIPEAATIVAVADAFDAMTSDRPYRPARSVARAVREITAYAGKQFSPRVVTAMARLHKRRMLPPPQCEVDDQEAAA